MGRLLLPALALAVVFAASLLNSQPAAAQGLKYFYCYAVDAKIEQVFVSDMHDVGQVAERATYGEQFSTWLRATGKASTDVKSYCVMRGSVGEIERGRSELADTCRECQGIRRFQTVAWLREGKGVGELLAGKLIETPAAEDSSPEPSRELASAPTPAPVAEPVPGEGAHVYGRSDMTDVTYAANEANARFLARQKADLKGGKWRPLMTDNRCPGWIAVAYASNGTERWYYVAQGAESEGDASRQALAAAEAGKTRMDGMSITGVLLSFRNNYERPPVDFDSVVEDGAIDTAKGLVGRAVTSGCPAERGPYATVGVRG